MHEQRTFLRITENQGMGMTGFSTSCLTEGRGIICRGMAAMAKFNTPTTTSAFRDESET